MKKGLIIIAFVLSLMVFIVSVRNVNLKKNYLKDTEIIGVYINNELSEKIPLKGEAKFYKAICDDENVSVSWDSESWGLLLKNLTKKVKCNLYFYSGQTVFDFDYTGDEQTFTAPISGTYKLEIWGAQGGSYDKYEGGYGGHSKGNVKLMKEDILYINNGGTVAANLGLSIMSPGGYNGGGTGRSSYNNKNSIGTGGGGATHISKKAGTLSTMKNYTDELIIVAGGGGCIYVDFQTYPNYSIVKSGNAGGYIGSSGVSRIDSDTRLVYAGGGSQVSGNDFGLGESCQENKYCEMAGGGGGYYGGSNSSYTAGGGSGYIGNSALTNKNMYCYDCEESNEESTETISTTCAEETPTVNCSKKGNGYARITLVSID